MEAGKKRLAGDITRQANRSEVKGLRSVARNMKEVIAEQTLELRLLKKGGCLIKVPAISPANSRITWRTMVWATCAEPPIIRIPKAHRDMASDAQKQNPLGELLSAGRLGTTDRGVRRALQSRAIPRRVEWCDACLCLLRYSTVHFKTKRKDKAEDYRTPTLAISQSRRLI